jgi:hypothetical protein
MWGGIWLGPGRGGAAIGAAEGRPGRSGVCDDMIELATKVSRHY